MKHRQAWSVLVLTLALTGRSFARDAQREAEEYRVCQAYLASPYAEKPHDLLYGRLGIFFIYNVKHEDPEALRAFLQSRAGLELDAGLAKDFVAINRHPIPIDRAQFPASTRYAAQFIQQDVYSLSRVGFNARKDEALLYASFSSLREEGHGSLVHLRKQGGTWAVTKAAAVWMYGASVHPFNP